jgi:excisionase family DNA binding protein
MKENISSIPFDQIPALLIDLADNVGIIKSTVLNHNTSFQCEPPIDVQQAGVHVFLDEQTIYRLVRQKKIPFHKQGRKLYFYKSELNDWIKSGPGQSLSAIQETYERELLTTNKKRRKEI